MIQTVTTAEYENITVPRTGSVYEICREIINHPAFMAAGTFVPSRSEERVVLELDDGFTATMSDGVAWINYRGRRGRTIECCHAPKMSDTTAFVSWAVDCSEGLKALVEE